MDRLYRSSLHTLFFNPHRFKLNVTATVNLYLLHREHTNAEKPGWHTSRLLLILLLTSSGTQITEAARIFTMVNYCEETIWPAITPGYNFNGGGFALRSGESIAFNAPVGWVGRIWARTGCNFDGRGLGSCQTGACGTTLKCKATGKPPATLSEFTLAGVDYYDVSLVDGFNLPLSVTPINGRENCSIAACDSDLRTNCPSELAIKSNGKVIACRSACDVYGTDEYCCRGVFGNSVICQPTYYSKTFKAACPTAYSYAYDDATSIFTCSGTDYVITFCRTTRQTVCPYHDNKLTCSGSVGIKSLIGKWWALMTIGFSFMATFL